MTRLLIILLLGFQMYSIYSLHNSVSNEHLNVALRDAESLGELQMRNKYLTALTQNIKCLNAEFELQGLLLDSKSILGCMGTLESVLVNMEPKESVKF